MMYGDTHSLPLKSSSQHCAKPETPLIPYNSPSRASLAYRIRQTTRLGIEELGYRLSGITL